MHQHQLDPKQEEKKSLSQWRVSSRQAADLEVSPQAGQAPSGQFLLELQERYGNRHVQRVVDAARLGHSLEAASVDGSALSSVQRQELRGDEEGAIQVKLDTLRMGAEGGPVPPDVESAIQRARGAGQPLTAGFSAQFGERLGHDFSRVRVHTDAEADTLNQLLSARAFTTGRDIFFRRGEYNPGSGSGGKLLAHELSHVVQQSNGRVCGGGAGMTVRAAGDVFEQEAEGGPSVAARFLSGTPSPIQQGASGTQVLQRVNGKNKPIDEAPSELGGPAPVPPPPLAEPSRPDVAERSRQKAIEDGFKKSKDSGLYTNPKEGSFEYVASYIYPNIDSQIAKRKVYVELYEESWTVVSVKDAQGGEKLVGKWQMFPRETEKMDNVLKKNILFYMFEEAFGQYEKVLYAAELAFNAPSQFHIILTTLKSGKMDLKVMIGFHGTKGDPIEVTGSWGGIRRPVGVDFFKTKYGLDKPWNPLSPSLEGGAFFRKGVNEDNELLSTVSLGIRPTDAIKFPFPTPGTLKVEAWLYAVVLEKAYPTFSIQKPGEQYGEVASGDVLPENIIGWCRMGKNYDPTVIKHHKPGQIEEAQAECFTYWIDAFQVNGVFKQKWGRIHALVLEDRARREIVASVGENVRGIYDKLTITRLSQ